MFRWWQWVDYRVRRAGEWLLPRLANLRSVWRVLHRVRFAWLLTAVACGALFLAQGQEILASSFVTLADALIFVLACTLAAASIWYCSRTLIRLMPPSSVQPSTPSADALRRHLPRVLGALVLLLPGTALAFLSRSMPNRSLALFSAIVLINLAVAFYVALQLRRRVVLKASTQRPSMSLPGPSSNSRQNLFQDKVPRSALATPWVEPRCARDV